MAGNTYKIIWTDEAKSDLKDIYDFLKSKSPQGAGNVISEIRNAPKSVRFSHQNQDEEYNNTYKRIVIRHYKILYRIDEDKKTLVVATVFDARQNPDKLKG
ncbi:type II toxin-antitoxin system RelE/ParE family toxin [Sinomicrobium soli]|uniref:type II toxin-antitoxin system RelE/ParE family toxin n=1 Tax=Sinomicrobium sp. N-1-3-6 TaxID=2219864 RepID=UPI001374C9CA|nr:type II toxin-antitoxin system RelE/ParE family toxin [Sinomicrobium sp. N-1-3-6]